MLTDGNMRNGLINTDSRWPFGTVPFVIDDVFSEYCSIKLQMCFVGRGGNYPFVMSTALAAVHTGV